MARVKITNEVIAEINELYLEIKTYAGVARKVGVAPSTVKKYIIPNYVPAKDIKIKRFTGEIPELDESMFKGVSNWGDLCVLTEEEKEEMKELWEEMSI